MKFFVTCMLSAHSSNDFRHDRWNRVHFNQTCPLSLPPCILEHQRIRRIHRPLLHSPKDPSHKAPTQSGRQHRTLRITRTPLPKSQCLLSKTSTSPRLCAPSSQHWSASWIRKATRIVFASRVYKHPHQSRLTQETRANDPAGGMSSGSTTRAVRHGAFPTFGRFTRGNGWENDPRALDDEHTITAAWIRTGSIFHLACAHCFFNSSF